MGVILRYEGGKTGSAGKWFFEFEKSKCHDLDDWLRNNPQDY